MERLITLLLLICCATTAWAQQPLYIVNGEVQSNISEIDPDIIERVEELPADEETIARYGAQASNGVVLVTLKYDEPARFTADTLSFGNYVKNRVKWEETDPTARVVLRYQIAKDGSLTILETLHSTDNRLKRRVEKVVEESPRWEPARKAGAAVESEGVLRIQLPEGRRLPRELELVIR